MLQGQDFAHSTYDLSWELGHEICSFPWYSELLKLMAFDDKKNYTCSFFIGSTFIKQCQAEIG